MVTHYEAVNMIVAIALVLVSWNLTVRLLAWSARRQEPAVRVVVQPPPSRPIPDNRPLAAHRVATLQR